MKTLLICHEGARLHEEGIARRLGSFSEVAGVVVIQEKPQAQKRRIQREIKRVGPVRFADVVAFRAYYRLFLSERDSRWEQRTLAALAERYSPLPASTPVFHTTSPNTKATQKFIREAAPDITLACCKVILKKRIFSIPSHGTYVMHPGHCPEYRNAHGCFWALASGDTDKISATLLKTDAGIDTGPIYGFYTYPYDEVNESHIVIQNRVVLDNLDSIRDKLTEIVEGVAKPVEINPGFSHEWGQPWLTKYVWWKLNAQKRRGGPWLTKILNWKPAPRRRP